MLSPKEKTGGDDVITPTPTAASPQPQGHLTAPHHFSQRHFLGMKLPRQHRLYSQKGSQGRRLTLQWALDTHPSP